MKIKFNKYQSGGSMSAPFAIYTPVTVNDAVPPTNYSEIFSSKTSKSSKNSSGGITDKDLLEMLGKIDGLPSDMNAIFNSIQSLYTNPLLGEEINTTNLSSRYLRTLASVKNAAFNKLQFDEAKKLVISNDGLNEVAIDSEGKIVVMDAKGKIDTITVDTYKQNKNKYKALSNQELLDTRAYNAPMDNTMLSIVSNGVGMEAVTKYLQNTIGKLGSALIDLSNYSNKQINLVIKGLNYLQLATSEGLSFDGIFKNTQVSKTQKDLAKAALNYLYTTLPKNMKALLDFKSNSKNGSLELIQDAITMRLEESIKTDSLLVLDSDGNKVGSKKSSKTSSGSSSGGTDLSPSLAFVAGKGELKTITLNPGSSYAITTNGTYGVATDASGHALGANASLSDLTKGSLAANLDFSKATMGGARLKPGMYDRVILNDSTIISMDLPITVDSASGLEVPNFALCKKLEKANVELQRQNIDPNNPQNQLEINLINQVYSKYELPAKYSTNGKVNEQKWRRFAAIQGKADESVFGKDPTFDHDTIMEVIDDNLIDAFVQTVLKTNKDFTHNSGFLGFGADSIYEGTIFIPLSDNLVAASLLSSDHFKVPMTDASEVLAAQAGIEGEDYLKLKSYNNPGNLSQFQ